MLTGDQQPQRVLAGHRRPGAPLRAFTDQGEVRLRPAAPAPTYHHLPHHGGTMTTQTVPETATVYRFEARTARAGQADNVVVLCQGTPGVVASAAREWAEEIDPYVPDPGINWARVSWLEWLGKLFPFARRR